MAMDIGRKWDEFRPTKTQAAWFAVGCVAATLALGFGWGGWVTGGKAEAMVSEASETARHELATAICVEEFLATKGAEARLAKLRDTGWYERTDIVSQGGWATMPDRQEPNYTVATMCAAKLADMKETKSL